MPNPDPEELADRLDRLEQAMQERTDQLAEEVSQTREDWEQKRADPSVPGAPPREGDDDGGEDAESPADQGDDAAS